MYRYLNMNNVSKVNNLIVPFAILSSFSKLFLCFASSFIYQDQ